MKTIRVQTYDGIYEFIDPSVLYQVSNGQPVHANALDEDYQTYTMEIFIPFESIAVVEVTNGETPTPPVDANCD